MSDRVALLRLVKEIKAYTNMIDRCAGGDYFRTERRRPRLALDHALSYAERTIEATPYSGAAAPPFLAALITGAALAEDTIDPDELEERAYQRAKEKKAMGRSVTLIDQKFTISAANVPAAFAAVRALRPTQENSRGRVYDESGALRSCHFAWTHQEVLRSVTSLSDYIEEWGYKSVEDETGLRITESDVGKWGDDATLFTALAPFADEGSYLEYMEEGGERWRFIIRGGRLHTETATISWSGR